MQSQLGKEEVRAYLNEKGIAYEWMDHAPVFTMEEMAREGITEKGAVCKNLFLRDAKGKQHFLVVMPDEKKADLQGLAEQLGSTKLSFASAERLEKYLGLRQGAVSPFGVLNDETHGVTVVFDRDLAGKERVGVHPNDNTATVWVSFEDLKRVIEENGNDVTSAHFAKQ